MSANAPGLSTYWEHPYPMVEDDISGSTSPIDGALQFALPPEIRQPVTPTAAVPSFLPSASDPYHVPHPYYEEQADTDSLASDSAPLKPLAQPMGGLEPPDGERAPRDSFQTVSDMGNSPARARNTQMLGFDLEPGFGSNRPHSYGDTLTPGGQRRSRSPSTSGALSRAGSIMRAMSQRVVMISGEGDLVEQQAKRERSRSRSPSVDVRRPGHVSAPMLVDTSYPSQLFQMPEKNAPPEFHADERPTFTPRARGPQANPLRGRSLGIFAPENPIRKGLCDILVSVWVEPVILILIVLQTVLLAVEAAPDVFIDGNARPDRWSGTGIDWAIFVLFAIFTLELVARIIVSGLIINPDEYVPENQKRRIRERVAEQYRVIFQPQRQKSVRQPRQAQFTPTTFGRSFTMMQTPGALGTLEEQQRMHLARRAFLRHGFNRLDFIAIVSFWISFVLSITGLESKHNLYVFRMLSCLRIIRLLALTKGNLVGGPSRSTSKVFTDLGVISGRSAESQKSCSASRQSVFLDGILLADIRHCRGAKL